MRYSEDRIKSLALKIHDRLYLDNEVDYLDEEESLKLIKEIMLGFFQLEDKVDDLVRHKIMSLKRNVPPGSPEWDVLYKKYFEEELLRHQRG